MCQQWSNGKMFRLRCLSQRLGRQRSMRISRIWIQLFSFISSSSLILEWNRSKVSYCLSLCFHQSTHFNVVEFFLGYSRRFTIQTDRFCGGTHKQFSLKTVPDRKVSWLHSLITRLQSMISQPQSLVSQVQSVITLIFWLQTHIYIAYSRWYLGYSHWYLDYSHWYLSNSQ